MDQRVSRRRIHIRQIVKLKNIDLQKYKDFKEVTSKESNSTMVPNNKLIDQELVLI